MTVVLEYPSKDDAPRVGCATKDFGEFKVYAVQFNDALAELEYLYEHGDFPEAIRLTAFQAGEDKEAKP